MTKDDLLDMAKFALAAVSDLLINARLAEANGDHDSADSLRVRAAGVAADTALALSREKVAA